MSNYEDEPTIPLCDYETAEADAIEEAMPMIASWHDAAAQFGASIGAEVQQAFGDRCWDIAEDYADRCGEPHAVSLLYAAIRDYKIKDEQK